MLITGRILFGLNAAMKIFDDCHVQVFLELTMHSATVFMY